MAKDSARLLLIDHSPECAEEVNSLLRNSGINVRVLFAKTIAGAEKSIKSDPPLLLIYNDSAPKTTAVTKILQLADKYGLTAAIRFSPEDPAKLIEALDFYSCLAINSEENEHLIKVVSTLVQTRATGTEIDDLGIHLDELQSRYNLLLESSKESIAYIHEGLHVYANPAYLELLQVEDFKKIEAVSLLEVMQGNSCDLKKVLREIIKGNFPDDAIPVNIQTASDSTIEAVLVFSPAQYDGENCIQMVVEQIDANTALKGELKRLRRTDPVTHLSNRKTFMEILADHLDQIEEGKPAGGCLYLAADNFSDIRSSLGLSGWDEFMENFAKSVSKTMGDSDIAGRIDDNSLAILAAGSNKKELFTLADRIIGKLPDEIADDKGSSITCSVGVAVIGSQERNADKVINDAIQAHALAAKEGNCAEAYKPKTAASFEATEEDKQWVERIRFALDNQELYSVQQSIENLEGESEGLFENLTYIRDESGDIPAGQFIPVAERNEIAADIDRHVIQGLMQSVSGTGDQHIISISNNSLLDISFSSWVSNQLDTMELQGSQLVLQVSAESAKQHTKPLKRLIEELGPLGCGFSLSHFDDEPEICAVLEQLNINMIKLRPGLTDDLANNSANQAIVRNVVFAAESKQVQIIADDIKDAADLAVLWQCGVKLVAGDFLKETNQTET